MKRLNKIPSAIISFLPFISHAGDPGGGGGDGANDFGFVEGTPMAGPTSPGDIVGNDTIGYSNTQAGSTPFLLTWNGEKYVLENDFLFGKPNTAFSDYKTGLAAYTRGIGGDTYLLQNNLTPDADGNLKLQIRELEPEESFIDKFELSALDLKASEHFVVDGNLEDGYIFDTKEAKVAEEQTLNHYHKKQGVFIPLKTTRQALSLTGRGEADITLESGDELIVRVPKSTLNPNADAFILVDSHYRDWSLGNEVPFSRLERFAIGSVALGRSTVMTLSGVVLLATAVIAGTTSANNPLLQKILNIPYTYADTPTGPTDPCPVCSNIMSSEDHEACQRCQGNYYGGGSGRSLVISAGDSTFQTYLQTLFPRYVQASQEVVRIPKEVIAKLKEAYLTVRIKATKKHKVRAAFVFSGTPSTPVFKPLTISSAKHQRDQVDYTDSLKTKNNSFLQTIPGDVVELTIKDEPVTPGMNRRYVLKANGFYTKMSLKTRFKIGKNWLSRLAPEDRELLKELKLSS